MKFKLQPGSIKNMAKAAGKFMEKNAPAICAGIAIAGLLGSVVAAVKAGPEVKEALEEAEIQKNEEALKQRMEDGNDDIPIVDLTIKEKLPIYFKYFWKTGLLVIASATCMIASVRFGNKQIRTFAVLAAAAESNLASFEDAAKAVVGEKKVEQIKGKIIDQKIEGKEIEESSVLKTGRGDTLCFEPYFHTYFRMGIEEVKLSVADIKDRYNSNYEVTYDDIYEILRLQEPKNLEEMVTSFNNGIDYDVIFKNMGYFKDPDGVTEYPPEFNPRSKIVRINGKEETCYIVGFNRPKSRYEFENEQMKQTFR